MNDFARLIESIKNNDLETTRSILDKNNDLASRRDASGATPLHYAALNGNRQIAELLLDRGAYINSTDDEAGATPAGWAIEYLRERGGNLAIELDDLAYAIKTGDDHWVARFLQRFPGLRDAKHINGKTFRDLANESNSNEIKKLFE